MRNKRRFSPTGIRASSLLVALFMSSQSQAQNVAEREAIADKLYRDAVELMSQGDYATACRKLEESYLQSPAAGTLLALGQSYEGAHQEARACQTWERAVLFAKKAGDGKRVNYSNERIRALKPGSPQLVISVPSDMAALTGLIVKWNDQELDSENFGAANSICVAPGEQLIEASAPGRLPFSAKVVFPEGPQSPPQEKTVTISLAEDTSLARSHNLLFAALGLSAGAVVGLALGGGFGADANSKWNAATASCSHFGTPAESCSPSSVALGNSAGTNADFSTVFFAVGGVLGAAAITTWTVYALTPPALRNTSSWTLRPLIGSSGGGALIQGAF